MFALLLGAHLIGDFLLQNDWMQAKSKSSWVCTAHVASYSNPFIVLLFLGQLDWVPFLLLLAQHWLQDRFALHLKWMAFYGQTPPDRWPVGPLCVDQAFHIGFLWALAIVFYRG